MLKYSVTDLQNWTRRDAVILYFLSAEMGLTSTISDLLWCLWEDIFFNAADGNWTKEPDKQWTGYSVICGVKEVIVHIHSKSLGAVNVCEWIVCPCSLLALWKAGNQCKVPFNRIGWTGEQIITCFRIKNISFRLTCHEVSLIEMFIHNTSWFSFYFSLCCSSLQWE